MILQRNNLLSSEKIILGIDPGTTIMGFGLISVVNKKMELIQLDELMLKNTTIIIQS